MPQNHDTATIDQLAAGLKISRRSVFRFRKAGMPADLAGARRWITRREKAAADTLETAKVEASARWRTAQAAGAELELKKRLGELVDLNDFRLEAGERLLAVKAAMLEIPHRVSPGLVGRSAHEAARLLQKVFSEACRPLDQPLASLAS